MLEPYPPEEFSVREVTYLAEIDGRLVMIEHVPARVSLATGEVLYSPDTVERIQAIVSGKESPTRTIAAPVFEFSAASA